jgi:hypothetical protein
MSLLPGKTFFSTPKPPPVEELPAIPEPTVMPDPDDQALEMKKRREFAKKRQRSGRVSTTSTAPQGTVLGGN